MGPAQKVSIRKERLLKRQQLFSSNPVASALRSTVESFSLEIRVISLRRDGGQIFSVGGRHCLVHVCNKARQFSPKCEKLYWGFQINPSVLKISEFLVLVVVKNKGFRFFVLPVHKLPAKFFTVSRHLYIPQGGYNTKGQGRKRGSLDILEHENAWQLLTTVPTSLVFTSPA